MPEEKKEVKKERPEQRFIENIDDLDRIKHKIKEHKQSKIIENF